MKIFFDFDGTLIDARQRLYGLFKDLVPECELEFDEYWEIKRNQLDHKYILETRYQYDTGRIEKFNRVWMVEVEKENWILHDQPFPGMTEYLADLSKYADLYLVTARQSPEMVALQIENFKWQDYFKGFFVTKQENEKEDLIRVAVETDKNDFFVGDTGKDIQAGKALGMRTIGVLSGFRNEERLLKYNPDFIIDNITNFSFQNYLP